MEARDLRRISIDEYIALDRASDERYEYVNGEAFAMAGGRPEHAVVTRNVIIALAASLRGKLCLALNESQKIATPRTAAYHYPDASVICGDPVRDARDENAFVNPTLLVEVLSPTTADYDRGGKFVHYRSLESLREYLVVDEGARLVEHHERQGDGDTWLMTVRRGGHFALRSIDATLSIADLWVDVDRVKRVAD
jgi:Uma2 family endonuclease